MAKSKVAVVKTSPATVLDDYARVMRLADYGKVLDASAETALKVNISWHFFYPASSTTPWQLDGVIRTLLADGFAKDRVHACHNRTVVIDARLGERENKQINVVEAHDLENVHLYEGEEWIHIRDAVGDLADEFLVLNDVYPKGFSIPRRFIGENILHLPTVKTHIFTTTTGAMKNAFGGLLNEHRHWTHPVIHETLVDLLRIQKKIHSGVFAVMDGTFAGDGPGPRCMFPHVKNVLLASADQVAIDAVAAKLMGFDPIRDVKYLRVAHDMGLGVADVRDIELVGDEEAAQENWRFEGAVSKHDVRFEEPTPDLLGAAQKTARVVSQDVARSVELCGVGDLPRHVLVPALREFAYGFGAGQRVVTPVRQLGVGQGRRARLPGRRSPQQGCGSARPWTLRRGDAADRPLGGGVARV